MLDEVKRVLRIGHTLLDDDITETIQAACADMIRAGVSENVAVITSEDPLIKQAIKKYCLANYSNSKDLKEGYELSYRSLVEELRKSTGYMAESEEDDS